MHRFHAVIVTPPFSLYISLPILPPPPPLPPLWLRCLQLSALSKSAGLNVVRETLLKVQGSISLVQMHRVSLKFHANRHILFKQLWGYPQEEACLPLLVLLTFSFSWNHQSHDVQSSTEWLGQNTNFRNIPAAIFTLVQMCFCLFCVMKNAQPASLWAIAHIIFYICTCFINCILYV